MTNIVHNADCLEVMRKMEDGSVGYFFFSPPYNMGNTTGGGMKQYRSHYSETGGMVARGGRSKWKGAALANGYDGSDDTMPHDEYVTWLKAVLSECWRLLDDRGAIFFNHKQRILNGLCITPLDYNPGLPVRQIITWARAGGINFNIRFFLPTSEWLVVFAKPDFRLISKAASVAGDVWKISQELKNPHPAPFPVELPARALRSILNFGKPVCDPFLGSGTTRIAAHLAGFNFVGMEISKEYCEAAERRYNAHISAPV